MPGKQSGCADPGKQKNDANGKSWGISFWRKTCEISQGVSCLFLLFHNLAPGFAPAWRPPVDVLVMF